MPNEFADASYNLASNKKKQIERPRQPDLPSKGESVAPKFLLEHENHFDNNTLSPDELKMNRAHERTQI